LNIDFQLFLIHRDILCTQIEEPNIAARPTMRDKKESNAKRIYLLFASFK